MSAASPIGVVPIVWNNADLADLAAPFSADHVLDEIARLGFEGCQFGIGFPTGDALAGELGRRGLRLAEVYAALPCTVDGPTANALQVGRERLRLLHEARGELLVAALDGSPGRSEAAGRAAGPDVPRLTDSGWRALAALLEQLAAEAKELGHPLVFHPHAGTFVEMPDELERLTELTDPDLVGICLDVGHWIVGGGDPVAALRRYGERVRHVHVKDVDPAVLGSLRRGDVPDFHAAIRARIFTELGSGVLDLDAVMAELMARHYDGWLMVEQDTCWGPPSEAAAIGHRVLTDALRRAS